MYSHREMVSGLRASENRPTTLSVAISSSTKAWSQSNAIRACGDLWSLEVASVVLDHDVKTVTCLVVASE